MSTPSPLKKLTRLQNTLCKPLSECPHELSQLPFGTTYPLMAQSWHGDIEEKSSQRQARNEDADNFWEAKAFMKTVPSIQPVAKLPAGKGVCLFQCVFKVSPSSGHFPRQHFITKGCQQSTVGKGQSFQPVVLGQLDNHTRKNEAGPLPYTSYKN